VLAATLLDVTRSRRPPLPRSRLQRRGFAESYLGLSPFTYAERDIYAGRDDEIDEAVARLTSLGAQQVLLFVTGASGSGKSSFVQAGLLRDWKTGIASGTRQSNAPSFVRHTIRC
jgi:hypothetical protein